MSVAQRTGWYFVSSVGVPVMSLATLPLFTTRLGPEEFGAFALGAALAGVVSATAGSCSMMILPAELGRLSPQDRSPFITAVMVLAALTTLACSLIVFSTYLLASIQFHLELLSHRALGLAMVGSIFNSLWAVCVEILTIEGRAKNYAITTVLQAVLNALVIAAALFLFHDTQDALFWGFAASALLGAASAARSLGPVLVRHSWRQWLPIVRRGSLAAVISSLSENGKQALERVYLGTAVGVVPLGLFAHAQYYKNAGMVAINALSRGTLPTALEEAREEIPQFHVTLKLWRLVQAFALSAALGFALIGHEIIGALTHGKFVAATPYAVAMLTILLLQTSGKPHSMLLLSRGKGNVYAHLSTVSIAAAMVWLLVSVPYLGVWGVISSFFLQILLNRIGVYRAANRIHRIPFPDQWVIGGVSLISAASLLVQQVEMTVMVRLMLLGLLYSGIVCKLIPTLRLMYRLRHPDVPQVVAGV